MLRKRPLLFAGCVLVAASVILYVGLEISVAHEQALSPGEKSLGVAVLGMLLGIPMILTGATGAMMLAFCVLRAFYRRSSSN
ncbi:MAG TPA: hypothetical protein VNX88_03395 [Terriglobales bacterium]|jgi:hypothetical protein|nr:hypothetical protein [Terriglobales bacterium]